MGAEVGRYFFHLRSRNQVLHDQVGMNIPDESSLIEEAEHVAHAVREVLDRDEWERDGVWGINVMDDTGIDLFTFPLRMVREGEGALEAEPLPASAGEEAGAGRGSPASWRRRGKRRAASAPLRAGERWKRRLPKACW